MDADLPLIIGEVCVDFSLATTSAPVKMRLGGIAHAARALWACERPYAVAAICPEYLVRQAESYFRAHGCMDFIVLGRVSGSPNIIVIGDVREIGHQGYEDILREEKNVTIYDSIERLDAYKEVIIFPGSYDLDFISRKLNVNSSVTIDIAYDVNDFSQLDCLSGLISTIVISTSSELFKRISATDVVPLLDLARVASAKYLLLKENRGGSRLFSLVDDRVHLIPAVLSETKNSVGVGDAYTAVFGAFYGSDPFAAALRGMQVATRYAQTTYPDDLKRDVQRDFQLSIEEIQALGGTCLPWHHRQSLGIYLAAPDFSYVSKPELDEAISSLEYHNFRVRRPIIENGEAVNTSSRQELMRFYYKDFELLRECSLVFAVPLMRDPGTLVEIGMAIALGIPVVTFDPRHENKNTMVMCGSKTYSDDLDICLNEIFDTLSSIAKRAQ
ncbi:nucleoside 2-deoxyribosyltransferase [Bosea vestrisii]|uniref:Nucleoside 2-deoxyribosyltransferase n=1 Tax=Bosea vestrisii TaxID=151416 RepID=A0ABW0H3P1_9HYPH